MRKMLVLFGLVSAGSIQAKQVVLTPDADADIRSYTSAGIGYSRTALAVIHRYADPSTGIDAKAYVLFRLPDDFGAATSATLAMTRSVVGVYDFVYNVNGLNDGIAVEMDWPDADNSTGTTWNNAPENVTTSPYQFTNAALVGSFTVLSAANGGAAGAARSPIGAADTWS